MGLNIDYFDILNHELANSLGYTRKLFGVRRPQFENAALKV